MSEIDYNVNQTRECKSITTIEKTVFKKKCPCWEYYFFILEGHNLECFAMMAVDREKHFKNELEKGQCETE